MTTEILLWFLLWINYYLIATSPEWVAELESAENTKCYYYKKKLKFSVLSLKKTNILKASIPLDYLLLAIENNGIHVGVIKIGYLSKKKK